MPCSWPASRGGALPRRWQDTRGPQHETHLAALPLMQSLAAPMAYKQCRESRTMQAKRFVLAFYHPMRPAHGSAIPLQRWLCNPTAAALPLTLMRVRQIDERQLRQFEGSLTWDMPWPVPRSLAIPTQHAAALPLMHRPCR